MLTALKAERLNRVKAKMPVNQFTVIYWFAFIIPHFLVSVEDFLIEAR